MRMNIILRTVLLAMLLLPAATAAVETPLRIATFSYPPYIRDNAPQPPTGVAAEIVDTAFQRMHRPVAFEFLPFRRALAYLSEGTSDALFTLRKTPERERHYHYSRLPLLQQDVVVFARTGATLRFTGDLRQLTGHAIGVVHRTSYGAAFDALSAAGQFRKLEFSASHEMNFRKLLGGRMDVVICSREVGLAIVRELGASQKIKVMGPPVGRYDSYLVFNKKTVAPALVADFDQQIVEMEKDGTLARLRRKYAL